MLKFKQSVLVASLATAIGFTGITQVAQAQNGYQYSSTGPDSVIDSARVVNVDPVIERYQVNNPTEHCWNERVPTSNRVKNKSYTPEVFGALIGAAVGNRFGSGSGRDAATVAGALLGTTIGRDIKHQRNGQYARGATRYDVVQRCETRDSFVTEERVVGYNVDYKYKGKIYQTFLDQDPGDRIKVRVSVEPLI